MLDLTPIFTTFPILQTERCLLREFRAEDAPDVFRVMRNPDVNRYLGRMSMQNLAEAEQRVQLFQRNYQEQAGICWAITSRASGQYMGNAVYWNIIPEHFRAEIGYILAPEWWGQGIMTEITAVLLDFGFTTMNLHSIAAQIDPENTASRRLLEKYGFVQEGYFREDFYHPVHQTFSDTAVLSLLKSDWLKRLNS